MRLFIIFSSLFFSAFGLSAVPILKRDSQITITIFNDCDESVQPIFKPSLPGREQTGQHVIKSKKYKSFNFTSNDYRGYIYSRIKGSHQNGQINTTHGQFDVGTGKYAISTANGFNVPLSIQLQGKQEDTDHGTTQCDVASCDCKDCQDGFHDQPGLLTPNANDEPCDPPVHECPPDFTSWVVHFC